MRKTLMASVLVLALAAPTLAGEILTPPVAGPPPPAPTLAQIVISLLSLF